MNKVFNFVYVKKITESVLTYFSLEETVYSLPPLQYNVTPRTLTLSSEDCNQELTLENMTLNTVPFECESTAGLHMTLSKGVISATSSVKIFVSWIEPVIPTLECKIKVSKSKYSLAIFLLFIQIQQCG